MKEIIVAYMLLLLTPFGVTAKVQKVACIGASITAGARIEKPEVNAYPAKLQALLGNHFIVRNFGVSSTTILRKGDHPYCATKDYSSALQFLPDIVFIDLGGNDAKLVNRKYYDSLEADYRHMVKSFKQLASHPRVILLLPFVSFETDTTQIWDKIIVNDIIPHLQHAAYEENIELLDMHSLLINRPELFGDKIHPDREGASIIAERLYEQLIQKQDKTYNIFTQLKQPFTRTDFKGYTCAVFPVNGHECKVVQPKQAALGKPWIWRARFWAHEPQTDIALLERGFHLVYCDAAELLGNTANIQLWNNFYQILTDAGLAKKAAMEGMSRGGVYVFNWAVANPSKVACVYVDNPLLNIPSWARKQWQTDSTNDMLQAFRTDYSIYDTAMLTNFSQSPVDKVQDIVKGNYPILILCADADEAVDVNDNTLLFEKKIKALHGQITVIHKPGFKHHPHSLPNPKPIVDFILNATSYKMNTAIAP
jgi:lysophospholipase L1-like esterase